jgi:hypothetical protein
MHRVAYVARAMRWSPLGIAAAVATAVAIIQRNASAAKPLEAISIVLASALGYLFDDPAADTLDASPRSLLRRRLDRVGCALIPTAALWTALVWIQQPANSNELSALTAMFAGLVGLSLGAAGIACRRPPAGRGGLYVGPALLALLIVSTTFPPRWRPLPLGDIPGGWVAIELRWTTAAVVGSVSCLWSSRDRARRPLGHPQRSVS